MMSMMPGMGSVSKEQIAFAELKMKKYVSLISSMTKKERADPRLLISDRTARER